MATLDDFKNFAIANVTGTYDASATSITVASGEGARFPASNFSLTWWNDTTYPGSPWNDPNREIVRCTSRTNDTLTIVRGQEQAAGGLPASTKNVPGVQYKVMQAITNKFRDDIEQKSIDIGAETVYVTEHGALGDGVADDTSEINAAITAGNLVIFPAGTYLVDGSLALKSSLTIDGAGPGITTIKLKNSASQANIFSSSGALANVIIRNLTIDGNETNNTTNGLGIQVHGTTAFRLENVEIKNCRKSCATFGTTSTVQNLQIRGCQFTSSHDHLVEVQNRSNTNAGNLIDTCIFSTPGLNETTVKAAILARGGIAISNCAIGGIVTNCVGIQLADNDGTLGNGAHDALVSNCRIVATAHASNVSIGLLNQAKRIRASNIVVEGGDIGFQSDAATGDDAAFIGCSAIGCGDRSWKLSADRNLLQGCHLEGTTTTGIEVASGAIDTKLDFNTFQGTFSTAKVSEAGVSEQVHARSNIGWRTENWIKTSDLSNTSSTWIGEAVNHLLDVTPTKEQCNVHTYMDAEPTNIAANRSAIVTAVSSTQVTLRMQCTAGGTAGFVIVLGCHVNARP